MVIELPKEKFDVLYKQQIKFFTQLHKFIFLTKFIFWANKKLSFDRIPLQINK